MGSFITDEGYDCVDVTRAIIAAGKKHGWLVVLQSSVNTLMKT